MRIILHGIWEVAKIAILTFLIVAPLRAFVFQPFLVRGASMEPNFHNSDYLIVDEISYRFGDPKRGEVIVFDFPQNPSQRYIKRIIGLPGETVEISGGNIFVYNTKEGRESRNILDETPYLSSSQQTTGSLTMVLNEDEYFVLGDNRPFSSDSRRWGVLPEKNIIGKALLRLYPPTAFAKVEVPEY